MAVVVSGSGIASEPISRVAHLAFDASYSVGGEPVSFASVGVREAQFVLANPKNGYVFEWDRANQKMLVRYAVESTSKLNVAWNGMAFEPLNVGTLAEVPASEDLSGLTDVEVLVIGQG